MSFGFACQTGGSRKGGECIQAMYNRLQSGEKRSVDRHVVPFMPCPRRIRRLAARIERFVLSLSPRLGDGIPSLTAAERVLPCFAIGGKIFRKNSQKTLDFIMQIVYYNQAVARKTATACYLDQVFRRLNTAGITGYPRKENTEERGTERPRRR